MYFIVLETQLKNTLVAIFIQVKDTLWEGGVRGVGLVWSPLIPSAPRVANHLMHIQDCLPSLLHAVNGSVPPHLDGHDVWANIISGWCSLCGSI